MTDPLPKERLATTDATGKRVYLYPAAAKGKYYWRKQWVHPILMLIFLVLPWLHVGGRQLILLDVSRREFFLFGLHLRAHDTPLILFLFLGFTFLIGLVTAIWGRLWCGWACPQTVFTESVFRKIETWVEGSHRERRACDEGPWTDAKVARKIIKWFAFTLVSLVITHSFLAYFVGSRHLLAMITSNPSENWASFLVILFTTAVILFDFGWFREQFCVIMCPYGRFQSVMLDSHSMVVAYDSNRGDPKRGEVPVGGTQGDCVNCLRCVQVCPTGIDIRRGLQMECIACTACIDACSEVMAKTKKPDGLIRYTTLAELGGRKKHRFTVRALAYSLLLMFSMAALLFAIQQKEFLEATILRASGSPYEIFSVGGAETIVNHFRVDLSNQTGLAENLEFSFAPEDIAKGLELVMPMNPLVLGSEGAQRADFFVRFPRAAVPEGARKFAIQMKSSGGVRILEVTLVGPGI